MTSPASKWWYAPIWASPRPESAERVNVGLLLGDDKLRVEYLPGLPRLASLVAPDELAVFGEIMESLQQTVASAKEADLTALRLMAGPQLQIGDPKRLYTELDEDSFRHLARALLQSPRLKTTLAAFRAERSKSERELDRLIGRVVPAVGLRVERRPTLQKLYEHLPSAISEVKLPQLARAVRSQSRDVLMDSILVDMHDPIAAVRKATSQVGRAFWYYNRLRAEIESTTGRQLRTVGVLLNGTPEKPSNVVEAREYIAHVWKQDADLVVDVESAQDVESLRQQMNWLTA